MKIKRYLPVMFALAAMTFTSCSNNHSGSHSETTEEHADHDDDDDDDDGDDHHHEGEEHNHSGEITFKKAQAEAIGLTTETVKRSPFCSVIKTGGQIQAPQGEEQTVAATAAGLVTYANSSISEGTAVRPGETIVTISAKNIQDGDPSTKARLAYETAEKEYQRAQRLVAEKIISAKEFEQAKLNYETARTIYNAQSANVTPSGVRVAATMGGYVKQLLVAQGEYVAVGQPIAVISQNRKLQLKALVPESRFKDLRGVNGANFKPAYDKNSLYKLADLNGRLVSYGKTATDNTSFIPVVFEFDNVGDLIAGSYAEIYLLSQSSSDVMSLPLSAITEEQGLYFVYVKVPDEDESYLKRQVTIGSNDGERVEITSGLNDGETVVTVGAYNIKLASTSTAIPHGHTH